MPEAKGQLVHFPTGKVIKESPSDVVPSASVEYFDKLAKSLEGKSRDELKELWNTKQADARDLPVQFNEALADFMAGEQFPIKTMDVEVEGFPPFKPYELYVPGILEPALNKLNPGDRKRVLAKLAKIKDQVAIRMARNEERRPGLWKKVASMRGRLDALPGEIKLIEQAINKIDVAGGVKKNERPFARWDDPSEL